MKKGTSISLVILIITGILHLSVANHYCSGKLAASKVSATGQLASCGMEDADMQVPLSGTNVAQHCCDDVVISYATDTNWLVSFSFIPDSYQFKFQILSTSYLSPLFSATISESPETNVQPPGVLISTSVDLTDICVFRI